MRVYEVKFIDIGFFASGDFWSIWVGFGLIVGALLVAQQFIGSKNLRAKRARKVKKLGIRWTIFAIIFSVLAWPVAVYVWVRSRI